jgi:hypothetical protein
MLFFGKARFEVSSPGVSAAASFGSLLVIEQKRRIHRLHLPGQFREKSLRNSRFFAKGQIGRVVEESNFAAIVADVGSDFSLCACFLLWLRS